MKFFNVSDSFSKASVELDLEQFFTDERWQMLGDLIPDGLIIADRAGIVRYMNTAAESINELSRQTVVGRPLSDFVKQTRLDFDSLMDAFAGGRRVNKLITDTGGRNYVMSTRCLSQWDGETNCFLLVLRNFETLAKLANPATRAPGMVPVSEGNFAPDVEPVLACPMTIAIMERGLRTMAMGSRLLILGESGVGKTELARYLHRRAGPPDRPFVHINCGSIPDSLFESEMFGYERGSFTGASSRGKKGLIEAADGGTLFLDEVGEIPLQSQAKILQVLEEGVVQRVGATAPHRLRLQVIAATNCDLQTLVKEGCFRRDLYYRLSVITLVVPPLRERPELIPLLLDHFLVQVNRRRSIQLEIDSGCRRILQGYAYPGNVRELQNIVEHLAVVCDRLATAVDLPVEQMDFQSAPLVTPPCHCHPHSHFAETDSGLDFSLGFDLKDAVRNYESHLIETAIQKSGSKRKAAALLKVDIATIVRKSNTPTKE